MLTSCLLSVSAVNKVLWHGKTWSPQSGCLCLSYLWPFYHMVCGVNAHSFFSDWDGPSFLPLPKGTKALTLWRTDTWGTGYTQIKCVWLMLEISSIVFSENIIVGAKVVLDILVCFAKWNFLLVLPKREVWLTQAAFWFLTSTFIWLSLEKCN